MWISQKDSAIGGSLFIEAFFGFDSELCSFGSLCFLLDRSGGALAGFVFGLGGLRLGLVDHVAVDLDPADIPQTSLDTDALFAGALTFFIGEDVGPQIAQAKADQHLLEIRQGFV